ncbi:competence type IV pilus major pilin ComGC [Loigolactobacillus jiayinensis]|uniref:Competence type IV pilus major pilin ComGC n=1 Tax=Loigolactobacillus jiayinensis TaxID=2486016 RepID=A0ABW1RES8_9LACO|nr:competence type IV pilus major pilin ComGC [Loigolactobacillus jiayinensis]
MIKIKRNCSKAKLKSCSAFTLIEMVVVLFIITLLILIILPNVGAQRQKAEETGDEAFRSTIVTQSELYQNENDGKVPSLDELQKDGYLTSRQFKHAQKLNIKP